MNILSEISESLQLMFRRPRRAQYAALCYRAGQDRDELDILLLTSRDTGRWVIPKGWPMGNKPGHQVAAQEALEEAGVIGEAEPRPFGSFGYEKNMPEGLVLPCQVQVHILKVTDFADVFKEQGKRKLEWVSPDIAVERVREPGLKKLIHNFARQHRQAGR